jgi:hypothetical protein
MASASPGRKPLSIIREKFSSLVGNVLSIMVLSFDGIRNRNLGSHCSENAHLLGTDW